MIKYLLLFALICSPCVAQEDRPAPPRHGVPDIVAPGNPNDQIKEKLDNFCKDNGCVFILTTSPGSKPYHLLFKQYGKIFKHNYKPMIDGSTLFELFEAAEKGVLISRGGLYLEGLNLPWDSVDYSNQRGVTYVVDRYGKYLGTFSDSKMERLFMEAPIQKAKDLDNIEKRKALFEDQNNLLRR